MSLIASQNKRIVILVSGSGTNMLNIAEQCAEQRVAGKVVAVIANKADASGIAKAAELGLETAVLAHRNFTSREAYDQALAELVTSYQPDVVVLAGFMRILTAEFVQPFQGRLLNIHPSLLPKYKGLHTHERALANGDTEHGVSVHFVTEELDGGPVILQAKIPIFDGDTIDDLQQRVHEQEYRIYPLVVNWLCNERLRLTAAGAELDGQLLGPSGYAAEDE
ncbi:phosphoribosylglycinamide formyltransferase [Aliidiomarina quisquiliarum]|uniref:phosphoribosylglycinamide formyltransferase n=1 Tax=Aliidiomarina quisquiliarum TaxID=2938947 RepID=UPI00208F743E|nr:phosphoribosylglycinamide formyltransferase [Aliidiomarina quisquiliarum]MCO4320057.1 phosphoribosylglycinamide formyltransferase [Aliidiomarina quisquiliarum]